MHKISPWLFLVIALMWLLQLLMTPAVWMSWVNVIALALVGIFELMRSSKK
jgi:membrane protein implicated in regulation of membrane protease activity